MVAWILGLGGVAITANAARRFARVRACPVPGSSRRPGWAVLEWVAASVLLTAAGAVGLDLSAAATAGLAVAVATALILVVNGVRALVLRGR